MNATEMDAKLAMSCEKQRLLGRRKTATLKPLLEQVFCLHNVSGACRRGGKALPVLLLVQPGRVT